MKVFNPDKELKGSKMNKKTLGVFLIIFLVALVIGYSFATYNFVGQTYTVIDSVVGEFNKGDIALKTSVDGTIQSEFPSRESGKVYLGIECKNGSSATWNEEDWTLTLTSDGRDKCVAFFGDATTTIFDYFFDYWKEGNTIGNPVMMAADEAGNVRYIGSDPNNYVNFNDEEWRIIGVFDVKKSESSNTEKRIKLIRSESIGAYSWDSSVNEVNDGRGLMNGVRQI